MTIMAVLVKATLVLGVAAMIQVVLARRMSAATRHLVWTLAIAGLLLLPPLAGSLPGWSAVQYTEPAGASPVFQPLVAAAAPATAPEMARPAVADSLRISWPALFWTIYLAGVALLAVRLLVQHLETARLVRAAAPIVEPRWFELLDGCRARLGVRRPVRLLRAVGDTMPMAAGVHNAAILLPAAADTWPEDRRRAVLLHELAHVERHDCLTQTLAALACAAYWVHPGVWWIARRLRAERELACDDRVLSAGENGREYAGHLLELAYTLGHTATPSVAVTMARPRELEGRMIAALDSARNRAIPALRSRFAGLVVLITLTMPVAAATITPRVYDIDSDELARATRPASAASAQAPARQTERPQFEVATIKPTPPDTAPGADFEAQPSGRLHARNNAVRNFIVNAYGVPPYLVVGGPDWIRDDRYDLEAKAAGEAPRAEVMLMLQSLLAERFQLRLHREVRDMPAYVMTVARGGARLQASQDGGCIDPSQPRPVPQPGATRLPSCGNNFLSTRARPPYIQWTATRIDMKGVAGSLAIVFSRPVVDRTGLMGFYDIQVDLPPLQPIASADPTALLDTPSVFAVLQEQLGLRVEEGRGPVEVLVIDRVERPTEN